MLRMYVYNKLSLRVKRQTIGTEGLLKYIYLHILKWTSSGEQGKE